MGYLLLRAAKFGRITVTDKTVSQVIVKKTDSFSSIAKAVGTTEKILKQMNPSVNPHFLKPGMVLKYQKAKITDAIIGWQSLSVDDIARLYNGHGDRNYREKLDYAYHFIKSTLKN